MPMRRVSGTVLGPEICMVPLFSPAVYVPAGRLSPLPTVIVIGLIPRGTSRNHWAMAAVARGLPDQGRLIY
jgi:hypothetical protein